MGNISKNVINKDYIMIQLQDMHKQGYTSICCMPAWLQNDYRDLSIEQAVEFVNDWIDEYKIKHEHIVVFKSKTSTNVMTESAYNNLMCRIKMIRNQKEKQS